MIMWDGWLGVHIRVQGLFKKPTERASCITETTLRRQAARLYRFVAFSDVFSLHTHAVHDSSVALLIRILF